MSQVTNCDFYNGQHDCNVIKRVTPDMLPNIEIVNSTQCRIGSGARDYAGSLSRAAKIIAHLKLHNFCCDPSRAARQDPTKHTISLIHDQLGHSK